MRPSVPPEQTVPIHKRQLSPKDDVVRNSIVSGSIAGIVSTAVMHPADVIRTKMQQAGVSSTMRTLSGPVAVLSHTLDHGGIRALYTGLALPLAAQAVYKATVFTANNLALKGLIEWRTQERHKIGVLEPYTAKRSDIFVCGMLAGGINAAVFVTPIEFVRNQLIAQHSKHASGDVRHNFNKSGPLDVIRNTLRTKGSTSLWNGLSMTVARDSIGCGFFFLSMVWTRDALNRLRDTEHESGPLASSLGVTMISGAVAGVSFWVAGLPFDTIKTWIQTGAASSPKDAIFSSIAERGHAETFKRLFLGWQVAYGRGAPSAAITLATYSLCYSYMEGKTIVS